LIKHALKALKDCLPAEMTLNAQVENKLMEFYTRSMKNHILQNTSIGFVKFGANFQNFDETTVGQHIAEMSD